MPALLAHMQVWGVRMATMLEDRDLGVLLGLSTLLLGVVSRSYEGARGGGRPADAAAGPSVAAKTQAACTAGPVKELSM